MDPWNHLDGQRDLKRGRVLPLRPHPGNCVPFSFFRIATPLLMKGPSGMNDTELAKIVNSVLDRPVAFMTD
jgi:hypothetical protein